MLIGWTTIGSKEEADRLASGLVAQGLAACVQVDGPIVSHYRWEGKREAAEEFRLTIKLLETNLARVEEWLQTHHPYDTPEWMVVRTHHVSEKYLSWAKANSTSAPL